MQPLYIQLWDLLLLQLTNWRWSWRSNLLMSSIAPILSIIAFGLLADNSDIIVMQHILTGNIVMSLLFGTIGQVSGHFAFIRQSGQLDFFATLPISRVIFIVATVFSFLLMSLPSVLVTIFVGTWILGIDLKLHLLIVLVIPLISISLCALGAWIGLVVKSVNEVFTYSNLLNFLLLFLGPVLIPIDRLPPIMGPVSRLSPSTYAASALRQVIFSQINNTLWIDILVMASLAIITLWFVTRCIEWHS